MALRRSGRDQADEDGGNEYQDSAEWPYPQVSPECEADRGEDDDGVCECRVVLPVPCDLYNERDHNTQGHEYGLHHVPFTGRRTSRSVEATLVFAPSGCPSTSCSKLVRTHRASSV